MATDPKSPESPMASPEQEAEEWSELYRRLFGGPKSGEPEPPQVAPEGGWAWTEGPEG